MTKHEFNEMAALVVRLRDVTAGVEEVNDELTKALAANADALIKSNAQCADYHKRIERLAADLTASNAERDTLHNYAEKLHSELVEVRAALASATEQRDSLKRTLDEWEHADTNPHERVAAEDVAEHVAPPVLPMCMTCHGCGFPLRQYGRVFECPNQLCNRINTGALGSLSISPYYGLCKSSTPVRHE